MTKETHEFITSLFEYYAESPSGKEPENAEALRRAWDELDEMLIEEDDELARDFLEGKATLGE